MAATKRGRLALVLDCAQEGDHVIFLEGGRFPLIPRNSSSSGRLCMIEMGYIHGGSHANEVNHKGLVAL